MKNKRITKKLNAILDFIILSIPIIYIILFFINHNFNPITNYEDFSTILSSMFGNFSIIGNTLYSLLSYFGISELSGFYQVGIGILDYISIMLLLIIIKDILLLIPLWFNDMLKK